MTSCNGPLMSLVENMERIFSPAVISSPSTTTTLGKEDVPNHGQRAIPVVYGSSIYSSCYYNTDLLSGWWSGGLLRKKWMPGSISQLLLEDEEHQQRKRHPLGSVCLRHYGRWVSISAMTNTSFPLSLFSLFFSSSSCSKGSSNISNTLAAPDSMQTAATTTTTSTTTTTTTTVTDPDDEIMQRCLGIGILLRTSGERNGGSSSFSGSDRLTPSATTTTPFRLLCLGSSSKMRVALPPVDSSTMRQQSEDSRKKDLVKRTGSNNLSDTSASSTTSTITSTTTTHHHVYWLRELRQGTRKLGCFGTLLYQQQLAAVRCRGFLVEVVEEAENAHHMADNTSFQEPGLWVPENLQDTENPVPPPEKFSLLGSLFTGNNGQPEESLEDEEDSFDEAQVDGRTFTERLTGIKQIWGEAGKIARNAAYDLQSPWKFVTNTVDAGRNIALRIAQINDRANRIVYRLIKRAASGPATGKDNGQEEEKET